MKKSFNFSKRLITLVITILILSNITLFVLAQSGISIKVNGKAIEFDVSPVIVEDMTLVPLRAVFESLGMQVGWEESTKTVFGTKNGKIIILQIDNKTAFINSQKITLDVPATIINSRTMVPASFIAESIGANVGWNVQSSTVTIETAN